MSRILTIPRSWVLPLPSFVMRPMTALIVAGVHVYLGAGHLWELFGGDITWTHIWKGFGAMGGAYVFAAIASRGLVRRSPAVAENLQSTLMEPAGG